MKVLITGHRGFIASNLPRAFRELGHEVINPQDISLSQQLPTGEHCVYGNSEQSWEAELRRLNVDVVVHNAAAVGTDVVALNPNFATLSNVTGTYNICRAADKADIPVLFLGTTVIYDTDRYQEAPIVESSHHAPRTFYGALKLAGEHVVRSHCKRWSIVRPLFCYGGVGDNNSLIAKTFYGAATGKQQIDMFLDPNKVKDYMRVEDFCDAVALVAHKGLWGEDWNVAAETPETTGKIVEMMSEIACKDLEGVVQWYPGTDYLGNHRLSSQKFRDASGWSPRHDLGGGLAKSWSDIQSNLGSTEYNPLKYLEDAKARGVDLTQFFNR
jgi:nucleoside-diphosphate-sugar epimerase